MVSYFALIALFSPESPFRQSKCSSPFPPIHVLITPRAEQADGDGAGEALHVLEAEAAHEGLDLGRRDRLVGIAAQPVVDVVSEVHAALALVVRHVGAEVAPGQAEAQAQQRDIDLARALLRARRGAAVPALLPPPEAAHAGAVIERKGKEPAGLH